MTTIAAWEAFAEATLTGQDAARETGRELAAQTPPVVLAKRARHRKPNRRPVMDAATAAQLAAYVQDGAL